MTNATTAPSAQFKPYPAYKDSGIKWLGKIAPESAKEYVRTRFLVSAPQRPQ